MSRVLGARAFSSGVMTAAAKPGLVFISSIGAGLTYSWLIPRILMSFSEAIACPHILLPKNYFSLVNLRL